MTTYVVDKEGKFIPATQRPDGTWRKARRVKNGYVPQEEVPLYESKGKQFAQRKPTLPPGLYAVIPSEKLNKAKKDPTAAISCKHQQQQLKQQPIPGVIKLPANIDTITNISATSYISLTTTATTSPHSTSTTTKTRTATSNNGGQKLKHSSSTHTNHNVRVQCEDNLSDKLRDELHLNDEVHMDIQKKIKKLRKKIREIEQIEEKIKSGTLKSPEKDQMDKVKRKKEIQKELKALEAEQQQPEDERERERIQREVDIKTDDHKASAEERI